ncbi:MAG TPA: alkaline phosphatase family protein, partial [Opitutaceae bacterium]
PAQIGTVFIIDLENRNWTQPADDDSAPAQIWGNPAAPFINSLVTPGHPNAKYVSYATAYHNVLATPNGENPSIHPSEPNYIWQEAGTNFGVNDDNDPYGAGAQVDTIKFFLSLHTELTSEHLTGLLQNAGVSWKSYQEDTNLQTTTGTNGNLRGRLTSHPIAIEKRTVPLASFTGASPEYVNEYNHSHQYNFAAKHDGTLFFDDTAGHGDPTPANVSVSHYAPLQQLATDLAANRVARYNLITPNEYNDMHTPLRDGFVYQGKHYTGDLAMLAQADNFLSIVIPQIEASDAFKQNGVIVIWTDETEGYRLNDFNHTLMEIVISPLAKGNAFAVSENLTHSADLATWQKVFHVRAKTPNGFLNDAANAAPGATHNDLSEFFQPGVIPATLTGAGE